VYGHRHDVYGFHLALQEIDRRVERWLGRLGPEDLLILTADHGCDPTAPRTDHTREFAPVLAAFCGHGSRRHDGVLSDVGATALAWLAEARPPRCPDGHFSEAAHYAGLVPELPEVETIRRQLAPHLEGRVIRQARILDPRWTRPYNAEDLERQLSGALIERVGRAGKYLHLALSGDRHLLVHLRMTGTLLFDPEAEPAHTRVHFNLDRSHRLLYVDPRRFGTGHLLADAGAREAYLTARLGAEPFTAAFTVDYLRAAARGRRAPVKAFLLDQRRIAGVGNIYADEALFRARIHPLRPAGRLTKADWERLHPAIEEVLSAGIDAQGATIDDFRHVDGARGSFQELFLVHRRAGQPCPACGHPVRKIVAAGRGTYVCERCQRRPSGSAGRSGQAASSSPSRPSRSAARSSANPPIVSPSITT
jgi:formamidopyrimidine-DNA glycosylase